MRIARDSNISRRLASSSPSVECKLSQPRIPRVASAPTGPGRRVPTPARAPGRADRPVALDFDRDVPRRRARVDARADARRRVRASVPSVPLEVSRSRFVPSLSKLGERRRRPRPDQRARESRRRAQSPAGRAREQARRPEQVRRRRKGRRAAGLVLRRRRRRRRRRKRASAKNRQLGLPRLRGAFVVQTSHRGDRECGVLRVRVAHGTRGADGGGARGDERARGRERDIKVRRR